MEGRWGEYSRVQFAYERIIWSRGVYRSQPAYGLVRESWNQNDPAAAGERHHQHAQLDRLIPLFSYFGFCAASHLSESNRDRRKARPAPDQTAAQKTKTVE